MASLTTLPDEIVLQILGELNVESLLACTTTSKRFRQIVGQDLWRQHCIQDFELWDERHDLPTLLKKPFKEVDWKSLYVTRRTIARGTQKAIDDVLEHPCGRVDRVEAIIGYGLDIQETLMRNINTPDSAADVLARRWYSLTIRARLQRELAIKTWTALATGKDVGLVEALHAFDVFVRREHAPCLSEVTAILEEHAEGCRRSVADWESLTTREKAFEAVRYLRHNDLVGLPAGDAYAAPQNSFIGRALTDERHPSLPLISTAIFCALAQILGLDARPCGFPGHVLSIIYPKQGLTLDDTPCPPDSTTDSGVCKMSTSNENVMYLDPFQTTDEMSLSELVLSLRQLGISGRDAQNAMAPTSTAEMVMRCARNIINAVQSRRSRGVADNDAFIDGESALYGALWALFILSTSSEASGGSAAAGAQRRPTFLPHLMERVEHHFRYDATLVLNRICPLLETTGERQLVRNQVRDILGSDFIPKPVKRRHEAPPGAVKYHVGQLFEHARYRYSGLIYGWDSSCKASEDWVEHMNVYGLERGKQQSFYHVLSHDGSTRYVAEDNIKIVTPDQPPPIILAEAGQWFLRWDSDTKTFVSNMAEEYPDL